MKKSSRIYNPHLYVSTEKLEAIKFNGANTLLFVKHCLEYKLLVYISLHTSYVFVKIFLVKLLIATIKGNKDGFNFGSNKMSQTVKNKYIDMA